MNTRDRIVCLEKTRFYGRAGTVQEIHCPFRAPGIESGPNTARIKFDSDGSWVGDMTQTIELQYLIPESEWALVKATKGLS